MAIKINQKISLAAAVKNPRIFSIDLVRIIVVATVIATHIMASGPLYDSTTSGLIWMLSHTSRNIFVLLSALVLMYSYINRPLKIGQFYRKRFLLVLLPYAVWTLIYQVEHGIMQHSISEFLGVYVNNFVTAGAMYHLYFLLITMQLYLLFPLLRYLYQKVKKYPWRIFGISLVLQLVMTAMMQYGGDIKDLDWWFNSPDNYILGYQCYIVAGMLIAAHFKAFEIFVSKYRRQLYISAGGIAAVGIGFYFIQIAAGAIPYIAAAVFQPYLVVESIAFGLALFSIGTRWIEKGMPMKRLVDAIAQDSFGIYLCHVFFIGWIIVPFQPNSTDWITAIVTLVISLPVVYAASFITTEIVRHTWISLLVTGRHYAPIKLPKKRKQKLDPALV